MKANAEIYLDTRPKKDGTRTVKIKVTHNRKRKYFSTDISLTADDFNKVMFAERRNKKQKQVYNKLTFYLSKANTVIGNLDIFTFDRFKEQYLESRDVNKSISYAIDKHIDRLKYQGKISTALNYECAKKSLEEFKPNLEFADVTPDFLENYEAYMTKKQGKSITTVSMYLRALRATFNRQDISKSLYPFGRASNKYTIPTGKNTKKALTLDEIGKIYNYIVDTGSTKEMARDYWMFLYLCNGMNVKDFCLLKWKNIKDDTLVYQRAKTRSTTKERKIINVSLKDEAKQIIKKWSIPSVSNESYIFPHLNKEMTPIKQRRVIQDLTRQINKYIKQIAKEVGINKTVTTYYARHSFATVLKRSGANTAMISELLGHSSLAVTENYLDSFEKKQIAKQTDVLTNFKKIS